MDLLVRNATAGGVLLGLALLLGLGRRWSAVAVLPVLGAAGCAVAFHWVPVERLAGAPVVELGTLSAWLLLGFAGRAARPMLPRSAGLAALVAGALLGDLAAVALLAPRAQDGRTAVRIALVASAGGLLSPIGTPVTLLLVSSAEVAPLAVLLALVAWPGGCRIDGEGSAPASALLAAIALFAAARPELAPLVLVVGSVVLGLMGRRSLGLSKLPFEALAWVGAITFVAWSVRHSGLFEQALVGIEMVEQRAWLDPLLFGAAFVFGAVAGEPAGALVVASMLDTAAHPLPPVALPLAVGLGVGGLGPLLLCRGPLREALLPLSLQVAVALAWLVV